MKRFIEWLTEGDRLIFFFLLYMSIASIIIAVAAMAVIVTPGFLLDLLLF